MAKETKKDPADYSVEEKLQLLYKLQTILSEIDKIKTLRGELPLEVQDLEDECARLSTRIEKFQNEIVECGQAIKDFTGRDRFVKAVWSPDLNLNDNLNLNENKKSRERCCPRDWRSSYADGMLHAASRRASNRLDSLRC